MSDPPNPFESFQFKSEDPFEAFQFQSDDAKSISIIANVTNVTQVTKVVKRSPDVRAVKAAKNIVVEVSSPAVVSAPVPAKRGLSVSSELVVGSASHYRIVMNSLRSWKKNTNSTSSVDEYQVFLSELSTVQTDFPFMVLCTGILGSQCRDIVAMRVTKELIAVVGGDLTSAALCTLTVEKLEAVVKSCNYFRSKAKALLKLAAQISFLGSVPETFKGLTGLPGIGPKIANLCLSVAFKHGGDIIAIKDEDWTKEDMMTSSPYFSTAIKSRTPEAVQSISKTVVECESNCESKCELQYEVDDSRSLVTVVGSSSSSTDNSNSSSSSSNSICSSSSSSSIENSNSSSNSSSSSSSSNCCWSNNHEDKHNISGNDSNINQINNSSNINSSNSILDISSPDIKTVYDIRSPGTGGTGGNDGGIVVDTHVHKVSKRIGWSKGAKNPDGTRKILENLSPIDDWEELTVLLINLGQTLCGPSPQCGKCPLKFYCSYAKEVASSSVLKVTKGSKKPKLEPKFESKL